jgi:hypothetical protein
MWRALLALHNIHVIGKRWNGKAWAAIKVLAPEWVIELLEMFIKILTPLEEQELKLTRKLQEAALERKIPRLRYSAVIDTECFTGTKLLCTSASSSWWREVSFAASLSKSVFQSGSRWVSA